MAFSHRLDLHHLVGLYHVEGLGSLGLPLAAMILEKCRPQYFPILK